MDTGHRQWVEDPHVSARDRREDIEDEEVEEEAAVEEATLNTDLDDRCLDRGLDHRGGVVGPDRHFRAHLQGPHLGAEEEEVEVAATGGASHRRGEAAVGEAEGGARVIARTAIAAVAGAGAGARVASESDDCTSIWVGGCLGMVFRKDWRNKILG